MQHEFWPGAGPTSEDMMMCEPSRPTTALTGKSTSSRAGSRARTSAMPERVQDSLGNAPDSGLNSLEWFARFDPDSSSWRTSQLSLLGGLMPFSGRWPRSGTMRNGSAFRRRPLVSSTTATACSFAPTARAQYRACSTARVQSGRHNFNLEDWLAVKLLAHGQPIASQVNPAWLRWWMGFPNGWGEGVSAVDSETLSCPR